ncbi:hypothetical protein [Salmonella phage PS3-1]|nr:hypothetical protein [Salmonella phage PS3-1]
MVSLEPTTAWFRQCATNLGSFYIKSISYPVLTDHRIRTYIFHQLRLDNTNYTRTAVLLHK